MLVDINPNTRLAVMLDNLNVHKANLVKSLCKRHDVELIFNVSYSPLFNPIEGVFSVVKAAYKKKKLSTLVNGRPFNMVEAIKRAFRTVTVDHVTRNVEHSMRALQAYE